MLAVNSAIKGTEIDWGKWGLEKLVSYGTTLLFAGYTAIKDAGNALKKGA